MGQWRSLQYFPAIVFEEFITRLFKNDKSDTFPPLRHFEDQLSDGSKYCTFFPNKT